jgi:hypothetical protein
MLFQIEIQNGHGEIIGKLAIFLIAINHAEEFFSQINFAGIFLLRPHFDDKAGIIELLTKIFRQLGNFIWLQDRHSNLR